MNVRYLSIAEEELAQAIEYYESKETGLGLRFYTEYRSALKRVIVYPGAWFPLSENTRPCRTRVFPFGIIYQIREDGILIIAVSQLYREPDHWKDRLLDG